MTEEATEKKVVNRSIAIVLGLFCILLASVLVMASYNYGSIISERDGVIAKKDSALSDYEDLINDLASRVEYLEAPRLQVVNFNWTDHHPQFLAAYVHVTGAIFNSGTNNATNVNVQFLIYDSNNTVIGAHVLFLGTIRGKSYQNFNQDYNYYNGIADHVSIDPSFSH